MQIALPFCSSNYVSSPQHCLGIASSRRCSSLWPASSPCHLHSPVLILQTTSASLVGCFGDVIRKEWGSQSRPRGNVGTAHSTQDDEVTTEEGLTSKAPPPPPVDKKAAAKAEVEKGQTTAVITGVISVMLGVGYLVLLQVLDTRGVNLIPPPPEAFDP